MLKKIKAFLEIGYLLSINLNDKIYPSNLGGINDTTAQSRRRNGGETYSPTSRDDAQGFRGRLLELMDLLKSTKKLVHNYIN